MATSTFLATPELGTGGVQALQMVTVDEAGVAVPYTAAAGVVLFVQNDTGGDVTLTAGDNAHPVATCPAGLSVVRCPDRVFASGSVISHTTLVASAPVQVAALRIR